MVLEDNLLSWTVFVRISCGKAMGDEKYSPIAGNHRWLQFSAGYKKSAQFSGRLARTTFCIHSFFYKHMAP